MTHMLHFYRVVFSKLYKDGRKFSNANLNLLHVLSVIREREDVDDSMSMKSTHERSIQKFGMMIFIINFFDYFFLFHQEQKLLSSRLLLMLGTCRILRK